MTHQLDVERDKVVETDAEGHVLATKDYTRVHAGYVATTHNPRVSDAAKHNAEQLLYDLESAHGDVAPSSSSAARGRGDEQVHVPTTAENPHDTRSHDDPHAFHRHDDELEREQLHAHEVHRHRQIGAYKGVLYKQGVSDEAKQHARNELEKLGVDPAVYQGGGGKGGGKIE
ncbi:hypothetical protein JCM11491_004161 [Sporobolomyces phaffii]